jgi:hypothetical protein
MDDGGARYAGRQREPRSLGLRAAHDELRQLDSGQRGGGKSRQNYDYRGNSAHGIPSNCRSTLAWYRRDAA